MSTYNDQDAPLYSISTAAQLLGVTPQTLRLYEAEGLILPVRSNGNQRKYSKNDLERLECLRHALQEQRLTVSAIQHILALIPCWEMIGCTEEERARCEAYTGHSQPCWSYNHVNNPCVGRDCRSCEVYRKASDCSRIKHTIIEATTSRHRTSTTVVEPPSHTSETMQQGD